MTVVGGVIDPNNQGKSGLLFHNEVKIMSGMQGDTLGWLLVLQSPLIKVSGKL